MLSPEQEKWIAQLSNQDQTKITPFKPTPPMRFESVNQKIIAVIGTGHPVEHREATS
jgi:hypothetical protein